MEDGMNQIEDVLGERMRSATAHVHLSDHVFTDAVRRHRRHQLGARVAGGGATVAAMAAVAVAVAAAPGAGPGNPADSRVITASPRHNTIGTIGHHGRITTAAQALNLAAVQTVATGDPVVGPGQFTHVVTDSWFGEKVDKISFQSRARFETWVPADGKGTWYWRESWLSSKFATAADERYMKVHHPDELKPTVVAYSGHNGRKDPSDGSQPKGDSIGQPDWAFPTPTWLATVPRDPQALLAAINSWLPAPVPGTPAKGDLPTLAFSMVSDLLQSGIVPADLRAALYKVLIKLPGVTLISSTVNVNGRKGIAIGRLLPYGNQREEIIFDSASLEYIGSRQIVVHPDVYNTSMGSTPLPPGSIYSTSAVTVNVTSTHS
jgi:hypothetical protein